MMNLCKCYKGDKVVQTYSNIISVKPDNKYPYFIFHQKIYHHDILFTKRFADMDKVVYTYKGVRKEVTKND